MEQVPFRWRQSTVGSYVEARGSRKVPDRYPAAAAGNGSIVKCHE